MRSIIRFSFYRRLQISFLALILLPIIFVSIISYYNTQMSIRENIRINNEWVASLLAGDLTKMIDDVTYASNFFVQDPAVFSKLRGFRETKDIGSFTDYQNYKEIRAFFHLVSLRTLNNRIVMFLANPQGFIIQSSEGDGASPDKVRQIYERLHPAVDPDKSTVMQWLGTLPSEEERYANDYYAARVIRDPSDFTWLATLYAVIPYNYFEQLLVPSENARMALFDDGCRFIAGQADVICAAHTAASGHIRSEATIVKNGWKLVYETPESKVTGEVRRNFYYSALIIVSCSLLFFLISFWIARRLYQPIRQIKQGIKRFGEGQLYVRFKVQSGDEIEELGNTLNTMVDQINLLIANIEKEQEEKREMELQALSSQIHPHFLINTLNSIKYSLAMENNEYHSRKIDSIIKLLRAYMKFNEPSTIGSECSLLQSYIDIMQMRNEMDIEYTAELLPGMDEEYMPKLLLQPLVENAIVHGFSGGTEHPVIFVRSFRTNHLIQILIEDNGSGCDPGIRERLNQMFASGQAAELEGYDRVGMVNTFNRLRKTYGDDSTIRLYENEKGGTTVFMQFPGQARNHEGGGADVEGSAGGR